MQQLESFASSVATPSFLRPYLSSPPLSPQRSGMAMALPWPPKFCESGYVPMGGTWRFQKAVQPGALELLSSLGKSFTLSIGRSGRTCLMQVINFHFKLIQIFIA